MGGASGGPAAEECLARSELVELQTRRLAETVLRARRTELYAGRFPDRPLHATAVAELPLTRKSDLRSLRSPMDAVAVDPRDVRRWHASSGTTGAGTALAYTAGDLALWATLTARALTESGVVRGMVVHNAYGYGLSGGGLGFHGALEIIGAAVIPASTASGEPAEHLALMRELDAEALLCTPSFAASIAERVERGAPRPRALSIGVHGGESWSDALRERIVRGLGVAVFDTYGVSGVIGPGVAHECREHRGAHLHEDHFLVEVLRPGGDEAIPEGESGELVLTTLSAEACPRLRYRTGDIVRLSSAPCPCGRTTRRIVEVAGRESHAVRSTARGRLVMPKEIEERLLGVAGTGVHYQLTVSTDRRLIRVDVEPAHDAFEAAGDEDLRERCVTALDELLGEPPALEVVPVGRLPRSAGKAPRIKAPLSDDATPSLTRSLA